MDNKRKAEVLRYLGYKNQEIDSMTNKLIEDTMDEIKYLIKERYTYEIFEIARGKGKVWLKDSKLKLVGKDIKNHLEKSQKCVLIAATLGHEVDTKIRFYEKISMTKALILDACATVLIEELCDRICLEIKGKLKDENMTLTDRFSPGYGDLPIEVQEDFLLTLNARKTIGLTATTSSILIPRKSVTAIAGVIQVGDIIKKASCANCNKYDTCTFSKEENSCGS